MFKPKLIIRVDDIHPRMNYKNFLIFTKFLDQMSLPALFGLIPDNRDPKLMFGDFQPDLYDRLRTLVSKGSRIAQHGYTHVYDSFAPTLRHGFDTSEFAGHSFSEQSRRIRNGKDILSSLSLPSDVFMAPGHSFDVTTIKVLHSLGFKSITDGISIWPYVQGGLVHVPQIFSGAHGLPFGIYTTCLHLDKMTINSIKHFFRKLSNYDVISYEHAMMYALPAFPNLPLRIMYRAYWKYKAQK